ncbi:unnamed protein product [Caenorhabditis nigoni]
MPIFLAQWLNANCPEWKTAPLDLVNAHLWLQGPQEVIHVNGTMVNGILQMSNAEITMVVALTHWLDEHCPEWQNAPLPLVNAHLALLGPKAITLINGQVVVGTLQMAGVGIISLQPMPGPLHYYPMSTDQKNCKCSSATNGILDLGGQDVKKDVKLFKKQLEAIATPRTCQILQQ